MQELAIELKNIEKSYKGKTILTIDQLDVYQNDKIGIIGDNGQGKSTLLNLIDQTVEPDKGQVHVLIDFQYYRQIAEVSNIAYDKVDPEIISRLKVPECTEESYSGGEETRARLAEAFSRYTMGMLMDEPTTHLDSEGVQFLIEELTYYYGTLLVVSHDRKFLDKVVDTIWEVKEGSVNVYNGNYSSYLDQKEQLLLEQEREYEKFQKEKSRLEKAAIEKQKHAQKMNKVSNKKKNKRINPGRLASSKQKDTVQKAVHKAAKAIEKRIDNLDAVERITIEKEIQFPESKSIAIHNPYPIMGENVTIQQGNKILLDCVDFQFKLEKKIGITGPNGSGKTSLLKHIIENSEGITLSPKVIFSVYNQMDYKRTENTSMIDYLMQESEYQEPLIRAVLNNLGFSQHAVRKAIQDLSGGEVTRLVIAKLFTEPSNVLVLDEPTNFIDIKTIEGLERLIHAYKGTVIFTSHDHYFMKNVADEVWEIKDNDLILRKY